MVSRLGLGSQLLRKPTHERGDAVESLRDRLVDQLVVAPLLLTFVPFAPGGGGCMWTTRPRLKNPDQLFNVDTLQASPARP